MLTGRWNLAARFFFRTEAPPSCTALMGAMVSPGRMRRFLLGCANRGNRQSWHSADSAILGVKFPLHSHRFSGCQGASCPPGLSLVSGLDARGLTVPATGQAESGLCSHAISWQIVAVFASPAPSVSLLPCPVLCRCICHSTPALWDQRESQWGCGEGGDPRGQRRYGGHSAEPCREDAAGSGVRCWHPRRAPAVRWTGLRGSEGVPRVWIVRRLPRTPWCTSACGQQKGRYPLALPARQWGLGSCRRSPGPLCCRVKQPLRATQGPCSKDGVNHLVTSLFSSVKQLHLMSSWSSSFSFSAERVPYRKLSPLQCFSPTRRKCPAVSPESWNCGSREVSVLSKMLQRWVGIIWGSKAGKVTYMSSAEKRL